MTEQLLDSKLKSLTLVCKESKNYKKLSIAYFILIKNRVIEIGIKLGVRPIKNTISSLSHDFKIHDYITLINSIFLKNSGTFIFPERISESIHECEVLFLRNKGKLPHEFLNSIINIYYELRKLTVPNLHRHVNEDDLRQATQGGMFSFFTSKSKQKNQDSHNLKPLILQRIREKEKELHQDLNSQLDPTKLESAIYLKSFRKILESRKNNKIIIQGALKDNISYQNSLSELFGYLIIGVMLTLLSVGLIILFEMSSVPMIVPYIDSWVVYLFVGVVVLIFLYIKFVKKEGI